MSDTLLFEAPASLRHSISQLDIGESFAKCERMELELLTRAQVTEQTRAMRNTVCAAARRAKTETGHDYAVETGSFLTSNRDLMLLCIVTRRS